ncbi:MAG: trypsin-like peptidase domain-containing protein [Thermoanaerobaculia bacterium]
MLTAKHVVEPWKLKLNEWDDLSKEHAAKAEYDRLQIRFPGQQPINATVAAVDEVQDLALLQVQATTAPDVGIVKSNGDVKVTDRIAVLGYPASLGQKPVVVKNLSGFGSEWTKITQVTPTFVIGTVSQPLTGAAGSNYLHFDASVTHGNSGGAVVNDRGEIVGIVSAQFQQQDSIKAYGLEIPIQVPVGAGNMAVSPDVIQAFLRNRGII